MWVSLPSLGPTNKTEDDHESQGEGDYECREPLKCGRVLSEYGLGV